MKAPRESVKITSLRAQTVLRGVVALRYQHHHVDNEVPQLLV